MILVNNIAKPGEIRRIELLPDMIKVNMYDGSSRVYRLGAVDNVSKVWQGTQKRVFKEVRNVTHNF